MGIEISLRRFIDCVIPGQGEMNFFKEDITAVLTRQLGKKPLWDEGISYNEKPLRLGGLDMLAQLQRYAAHADFTKSSPDSPVAGDRLFEDEYLIRYWGYVEDELSSKDLSFRHIIWTGSIGIFFIPVDFPVPLFIEEEEYENEEGLIENIEYITIGSSYKLLKELDTLNQWLKLQGDFGELGEMVSYDVYENDADPWHEIKWVWLVLHWMARQSIEKKLTIYCEYSIIDQIKPDSGK